MIKINEKEYLTKVHDKTIKRNSCKSDSIITNDMNEVTLELGVNVLDNKDIEYVGTYILEKLLYIDTEFFMMPFDTTTLQKARVISVNPGSDNIGREQRYIHFYIVLAEYENIFIGVPITNMAFDKDSNKYILRNPFEVELINPSPDISTKPFFQYWVTKPSVADLRNIAGLDKRRIVKNSLYKNAKYAPDEYMQSIRNKLKEIFNIL